MSIIEYFLRNQDFVIECTKNSFALILTSLLASLIIWVPLGILISRNDKLAKFAINIASIIFCIPSLALFSIMVTIPFLGIGRKSAIVALVLYSMMPLLRSIYFGLKSVDPSVIEAAKGMGMNNMKILKEISLPLALRSIFSGFRVSFVMMTGTSTIATYIGEKNIGRIISNGLARQDMEMVIAGTLLISVTTLIIDIVLELIEKKVVKEY